MPINDWNDKVNGDKMSLSTEQVKEGLRSLKIASVVNQKGIKILTQTETDNPTDLVIEFYWYLVTTGSPFISQFFRYQDLNNYYAVIITLKTTSTSYVQLKLRESDSQTSHGQIEIPHGYGAWHRGKLKFCELAGTVYLEIYTEVAGQWVYRGQLSQNPAKFTSGGGFGVGFEKHAMYYNGGYLDTTKIYY